MTFVPSLEIQFLEWEKFANVRLLLSYMICQPGKKLLFMGGEFGQWLEWNCKEEIHWDVLTMPYHRQLQSCAAALNAFYKTHPALFKGDFVKTGYEWVDHSDTTHSVFSFKLPNGLRSFEPIHAGHITIH